MALLATQLNGHQLTGLIVVQVFLQRVVADGFGYVFGDVARRAAGRQAFEVGAVLGCAPLVLIALVVVDPVFVEQVLQLLRLRFGLHPQQHVPVRRGVVVRLGHPKPVGLQPHTLHRCARAAKLLDQPRLRIARGAHAVIARVFHRAVNVGDGLARVVGGGAGNAAVAPLSAQHRVHRARAGQCHE